MVKHAVYSHFCLWLCLIFTFLNVGHGSNSTLNKQEEILITAERDDPMQELYVNILLGFFYVVSFRKTFVYVTSHKPAAEVSSLGPAATITFLD